jgi:hypothetical protein
MTLINHFTMEKVETEDCGNYDNRFWEIVVKETKIPKNKRALLIQDTVANRKVT